MVSITIIMPMVVGTMSRRVWGSRLMPRTVNSAQSQPFRVFASDAFVIMIATDVSLS